MFDRKSTVHKEGQEAQKAAEEEERKEELIKKAEEEKKRQAEETRKQMDALKEKKEAAARKSQLEGGEAATNKSRVNRACGASSLEVNEINAAIARKQEEKKIKAEEEKKRKEEEQKRLKEEAIARGEEWVEAKESKWGSVVKGNLGGAALRLRQIQEKSDAARAAALGLEVNPNEVKGGGTAAEAARAAAPTRSATIAEKLAARNAAVQACGVFLTWEENKQREDQLAKLKAKIAELEKKTNSTSVASAVASKVRRMSITTKKPATAAPSGLDALHPDLLGGGGGGAAPEEGGEKQKPQRRRSILQRVMGVPAATVPSTSPLDA